jgi:hypothetical protein
VSVEVWDALTGKPVIDESGNNLTQTILADVDAFGGGLPEEHPVNQAYVKGRIMLGLPLQERFRQSARRYAKELGKQPVFESKN